jgi:uncharacterized protein YbjT (DUF2867 family)
MMRPKLRETIVDFERLDDHRGEIRGNDVFCCLGTTMRTAGTQEAFRTVDLTYVVEAAGIALRNGASRFFVVSSIGADPGSSVFYNRTKGEMEATISKMPFLSIGIVRPSLLLGERKEFRLGEKVGAVGMRLASFVLQGPLRKYRAVDGVDVAAAMFFLSRTNFRGVRIVESDEIQRISEMVKREK